MSKRRQPLRDWLARLGGADPTVLDQVEHPESERDHFARLGASLFVPFALGASGASVVGHVVTNRDAIDTQITVLALAWGALIAFVVDALLIRSTLDLRDDGRRRRPSRAVMLLLRFGLSFAGAFVVTEPLLTIIFSDDIVEAEVADRLEHFDKTEEPNRRKEFEESQTRSREAITKAGQQLTDAVSAAQTNYNKNQGSCEREVGGENGGDPGFGPQAAELCALETATFVALQTRTAEQREESTRLQGQSGDLETKKGDFESKLATDREAIENKRPGDVLASLGVFERVDAMHETVDPWMIAVFALLFLAADVLPVMYKQVAPPTEHDLILAGRRAAKWADQGFVAELRGIEHNTDIEITEVRGRGRVEEEKERAKAAVKLARQDGEAQLVMAQAEAEAKIADHAEWLAGRAERQETDKPSAEEGADKPQPETSPADAGGATPSTPMDVVGPPATSPQDFPAAGSVYVRDVAIILLPKAYVGGQGLVRRGRLVTPLREHDWADEIVAVKASHPDEPAKGAMRIEVQRYRELGRMGMAIPRWAVADGESKTFPILVFEYFPRASIDRWLFENDRVQFEVQAWMILAWLYLAVDLHEPLWHSGLCNPDAKLENYLVTGRRTDDAVDPDPPLGYRYFMEAVQSLEGRLPGRLVLCDLASICKEDTRAKEHTPGSSPPEWGDRPGVATFAGNVYSGFGVPGFRLATAGRLPEPGGPKRKRKPATYNDRVPPVLDELIADLLEPDPVVRLARLDLGPEPSGVEVTQHLRKRIRRAYNELGPHEFQAVLVPDDTPVRPG